MKVADDNPSVPGFHPLVVNYWSLMRSNWEVNIRS